MNHHKRSSAAEEMLSLAREQGFQWDGYTGPGKFEGNDDRELAESLHWIARATSNLDEDESLNDSGDWIGRIGVFILSEDSNGFFMFEEFESEEAAEERFEEMQPAPCFGGYPTLYVDGNPIQSDAFYDESARVQLEWDAVANGYTSGLVNSAAIDFSEEEESLTVSISIGDPRGALTMTVRRLSDGRIVLHVPHANDSLPHVPLSEMHPGTFEVRA